jgi:cytochrome c-type biogenesis protein CcmH
MILWVVFALMTVVAALAVLWPLIQRTVSRGGSDIEIYRDQLDEVARDRAIGLIGDAEAEAARIEVSRRLIAADEAISTDKKESFTVALWSRRATALVAILLLPIGAIAVYITLGSPQLPGAPLAARLGELHENSPIATLISRLEQHLETNPNDVQGYELLGSVYMRLGRFNDAVDARRRLLTLQGENATRESDLGEALTAAAGSMVTNEAKAAFERALALDAKDFKAQFFIGLAAEQDGDRKKAAEIWRDMLSKAPPDAPWIEVVRQDLARVDGELPPIVATPGPNAQDIAAASEMSAADRNEMIRGMVARLADRLKQNGNDLEGWQRLLRAYMVLGERDKAHAAASDAKKALANEPEKLRRIEDAIKEMGLQG